MTCISHARWCWRDDNEYRGAYAPSWGCRGMNVGKMLGPRWGSQERCLPPYSSRHSHSYGRASSHSYGGASKLKMLNCTKTRSSEGISSGPTQMVLGYPKRFVRIGGEVMHAPAGRPKWTNSCKPTHPFPRFGTPMRRDGQ
jgi:hypothetical protein